MCALPPFMRALRRPLPVGVRGIDRERRVALGRAHFVSFEAGQEGELHPVLDRADAPGGVQPHVGARSVGPARDCAAAGDRRAGGGVAALGAHFLQIAHLCGAEGLPRPPARAVGRPRDAWRHAFAANNATLEALGPPPLKPSSTRSTTLPRATRPR